MHRILLLWLLIFTLPVQGWAALAHTGCQSAPQAPDAFVSVPSQAAPDAGMAAHDHAAMLAGQDSSQHDGPLPGTPCSGTCHACCLAPSMTPPQARPVAAFTAGLMLAAWQPAPIPEAPTARLERPPRPALAA